MTKKTIRNKINLEFKISDLKFKHLNDIIKIETSAYGEDHWNRDVFYSELDRKNSYNKVVLNNKNKAVAFLISSYLFEEAELLSIAVLKEYRGQGLSKLLIEDFIRHSKFNGIEKIFLEVKETNKVAKSLYKRFNFKVISQRKNYYSDGTNADIMVWELA